MSRSALLILLFSSLALMAQTKQPNAITSLPYPPAQRLLVVTTPDWDTVDGSLLRYEWKDAKWLQVGSTIPVVVGKNGLGWDPNWLALYDDPKRPGPVKHEGDGKSPAGYFFISDVFGFSTKGPTPRKYIPLAASTECVDDVSSKHYAHIVDRGSVGKVDWNSSEKMREIEVYKLGMVVDYNLVKTSPGNGSCIFLHIWKGPGRGTAGCTAMDEKDLAGIVDWIGNEKAALVQLPRDEYQQVKKTLALP